MRPKRSVGLEMRTMVNLIKRQVHPSAKSLPKDMCNLTAMHGWAIGYLFNNQEKDVFQKDFEKEFSIRRSTASRILKTMETNGLITRETVPYDTRLKKIVLTEKAKKMHAEAMKRIKDFEQKLTKDIPEEKLEVYFEVMDKMKQNIES